MCIRDSLAGTELFWGWGLPQLLWGKSILTVNVWHVQPRLCPLTVNVQQVQPRLCPHCCSHSLCLRYADYRSSFWCSKVSECQGFIHPSIPLYINPITAPGIDAAYLSAEEKNLCPWGACDWSRKKWLIQNLHVPPVPQVSRAVHKNVLQWFLLFGIRMVIKDCLYTREKGLGAVGSINLPCPATAMSRPMGWAR